jgi:general stress protein 26
VPSDKDIKEKFWKALKSDRTVMLGLAGEDDSQPMTALVKGEEGPIWIFTSKETDLAGALGSASQAVIQFAAKGHDLFANVQGRITADNNRAMIDELWSPFIAAWFEGGKDDPKLQLLRFDPEHAHIWLNENSVFAGIKLLLGSDPKKDYKDKVADIRM